MKSIDDIEDRVCRFDEAFWHEYTVNRTCGSLAFKMLIYDAWNSTEVFGGNVCIRLE